MKRERGTGITTRVESGDQQSGAARGDAHAHGCLDHKHPDVSFNKISIAKDPKAISHREREELAEVCEVLTMHMLLLLLMRVKHPGS